MAEREELTQAERRGLAEGYYTSSDDGRKALRIIDADAADRAALVARVAELETGADACPNCSFPWKPSDRAALVARVEAAERIAEIRLQDVTAEYSERVKAESEVASLRQRLESAESRIGQYEKLCQSKDELIAARASECAALRAEVERLRAELRQEQWADTELRSKLAAANAELERLRAARETSDGAMVLQLQLDEARAERDAANALLDEIGDAYDALRSVPELDEYRQFVDRVHDILHTRPASSTRAHLSAQPAAPSEPGLPYCERCKMLAGARCGICSQARYADLNVPTRTAAEQRVLDAMRDADIYTKADGRQGFASEWQEYRACEAELARREGK